MGRCMLTTTHGVTARSTAARSCRMNLRQRENRQIIFTIADFEKRVRCTAGPVRGDEMLHSWVLQGEPARSSNCKCSQYHGCFNTLHVKGGKVNSWVALEVGPTLIYSTVRT